MDMIRPYRATVPQPERTMCTVPICDKSSLDAHCRMDKYSREPHILSVAAKGAARTGERPMTTTFRISTTNGNRLNGREYASEAEAQEALIAHYGRDIHIELCGDRWLAWATEEDSVNDDGSRAIASIS